MAAAQSAGSPVHNVAVSCVMNSSPVTVDPSGLFAYVSNSGPGNISAYNINQTTGALVSVLQETRSLPGQILPQSRFTHEENLPMWPIWVTTLFRPTPSIIPPHPGHWSPSQETRSLPVNSCLRHDLPITASGLFAYVPNMGSGNISVYAINQTPGALTTVTGSPFTAGTSPISITPYANASGAYAYVPNMSDGTISAYTMNTDGSLTPSINTPTVTAGTYPACFTIYANSSGAFAYVANIGNGNISLYTINSDGSLSQNGNAVTADIYPASVTIYPNSSGAYAYAYVSNMGNSDITAFAINPSNGTFASYVTGSNFVTGTYPNPVTLYTNSSGTFAYVSDRNDGNIWVYSINGTNGVLTNIQTMVTAGILSFTTVTIDPQGPYAYASDVNTGLVYAFTINPDGTLTLVTGSPF